MPTELPFIARPGVIITLFLAEALIFHILFISVPPLRLKKTGWAVVQYGNSSLTFRILRGRQTRSEFHLRSAEERYLAIL
jgi:hypothetical protein